MSSTKTIPSGGLSVSSNPSARLQELLRQDQTPPAIDTEVITDKNTEIITESHAEDDAEISIYLSTGTNTPLLTETNPHEDKEDHTPRMQTIRQQRRKPVSTEEPIVRKTSVSQRIVEELQKEPVVRKTIDIPASLNEKLQNYCAAKRIKTERRVFLVLLENFLEEEGF